MASDTIPGEVAEVFEQCPAAVRTELNALRDLIFETAAELEDVGPLEETLKWGQPSYLTSESRSGTTLRIAPTRPGDAHDFGVFVHCQTDLIERARDLFGDLFDYDGSRGLLFRSGEPVPTDELRVFVAMALTYHRRPG